MNQPSTDPDIVKELVSSVNTLTIGREDDEERCPSQTVFYLLHLPNFLVRDSNFAHGPVREGLIQVIRVLQAFLVEFCLVE